MSKYVSRLHTRYNEEVAPALLKTLGLSNVMEVPKLDKIIVNMWVVEASQISRLIYAAAKDF